MPHEILRLFEDGFSVPFLPAPHPVKNHTVRTGVAGYLDELRSLSSEQGDHEEQITGQAFVNKEYRLQVRLPYTQLDKRQAQQEIAQERHRGELEDRMKDWDPTRDPQIEGDPHKTLFVYRLPYDITERRLRREFEEYGPIARVRIVADKTVNPGANDTCALRAHNVVHFFLCFFCFFCTL